MKTKTLTAPTWTKNPARRSLVPGFSIIELLGVLAIIGLIAALVFPKFGSLGLADLRSSARRIQGATQLCFNLAIMEKSNYRLAFDLDGQCWWAEKETNGNYSATTMNLLAKTCFPDSIFIEELEVLDRKEVSKGTEYIYFSPYGFVEPARIFLSNQSGNGFSLFTDPITGRIRVYEGQVGYSR